MKDRYWLALMLGAAVVSIIIPEDRKPDVPIWGIAIFFAVAYLGYKLGVVQTEQRRTEKRIRDLEERFETEQRNRYLEER